MKTLITCFKNDRALYPNNPHREIIQKLEQQNVLNGEVSYISLIPTFSFCRDWLNRLDFSLYDNFILCGGTHRPSNIYLELYARNQYENKDLNEILQISQGGENILKTTIDLKSIISSMSDSKHINISTNAGTHICNYLFYRCLEVTRNSNKKVIFIHVSSDYEDWKLNAIKEIISLITINKIAKKRKTEDIIDEMVKWNVPEDKDEMPIDNVIGDVPMHWHY